MASSEGSGRDEKAGVFTPEAAALPIDSKLGDFETRMVCLLSCLPLAASAVEKGLPLSREIAVTSGNAEEDTVVLLKLLGGDSWDGGILGWGVHLVEDFLRQGLLDSVILISRLLSNYCTNRGVPLTDTRPQSHQPTRHPHAQRQRAF